MKTKIVAALALAASAIAIPVAAQPTWQGGGSWNQQSFWRGAPQGVRERIDWLQRRIDRGIADGSLDRREARRSQWQLNQIERDADLMRQSYGRLRGSDRDQIQSRLDDLSQKLRWRRHNDDRSYSGGTIGSRGFDDSRGYEDRRGFDDSRRSEDRSGYDR